MDQTSGSINNAASSPQANESVKFGGEEPACVEEAVCVCVWGYRPSEGDKWGQGAAGVAYYQRGSVDGC